MAEAGSPANADDMDKLLSQNEIFIARTRDIGILTKEEAINFGATGPMLRASGVKFDLRRDIRFETPVDRALWDDDASCWHDHTSGGEAFAVDRTVDVVAQEQLHGLVERDLGCLGSWTRFRRASRSARAWRSSAYESVHAPAGCRPGAARASGSARVAGRCGRDSGRVGLDGGDGRGDRRVSLRPRDRHATNAGRIAGTRRSRRCR